MYGDQRIKVFASELLNEETDAQPGEIIRVDKVGIDVATGKGVIRLKEVQFPNGKRLLVSQLILGRQIELGLVLGQ